MPIVQEAGEGGAVVYVDNTPAPSQLEQAVAAAPVLSAAVIEAPTFARPFYTVDNAGAPGYVVPYRLVDSPQQETSYLQQSGDLFSYATNGDAGTLVRFSGADYGVLYSAPPSVAVTRRGEPDSLGSFIADTIATFSQGPGVVLGAAAASTALAGYAGLTAAAEGAGAAGSPLWGSLDAGPGVYAVEGPVLTATPGTSLMPRAILAPEVEGWLPTGTTESGGLLFDNPANVPGAPELLRTPSLLDQLSSSATGASLLKSAGDLAAKLGLSAATTAATNAIGGAFSGSAGRAPFTQPMNVQQDAGIPVLGLVLAAGVGLAVIIALAKK